MGRQRKNHYRDKSFSRGHVSTAKTEQVLKELGNHVLEAAKTALGQAAEAVVRDAKSRCPVYAGHKKNGRTYMAAGVNPGALRDSIKAEPNSKGTVYKISADAKSKDGFLYGQIVEFSPRVNRPFLYPALEANREMVIRSVSDAIRQAIARGR